MNASVSWGFHPRLVCWRPSASLPSLRPGIDYLKHSRCESRRKQKRIRVKTMTRIRKAEKEEEQAQGGAGREQPWAKPA